MKKYIYLLVLSLGSFISCTEDAFQIQGVVLENDYVEAEINGALVRFDAFDVGRSKSFYRAADPLGQTPAELRFTRTLANGMEDITIVVENIELNRSVQDREIPIGRAGQAGADGGPTVRVQLLSRDAGGSTHCPYLTEHAYDLAGTLVIDSWSAASGIVEGRFTAREVLMQEDHSGAAEADSNPQQSDRMLREGTFRVWVQQL